MGSPIMGSGNVVLPLYGPGKVKGNQLIVDPPMGAKTKKVAAKRSLYKPIKNTQEVNKLYKTY